MSTVQRQTTTDLRHHPAPKSRGQVRVIRDAVQRLAKNLSSNSMLLIVGAAVAFIWANIDAKLGVGAYERFISLEVGHVWEWILSGTQPATSVSVVSHEAHEATSSHHGHGWTLQFVVNDIFMAIFFAVAAKEVLEAFLPGGVLSNRKRAATPLLATVGGIVGPTAVFLGMAFLCGGQVFAEYRNGWAIPCSTDMAFSYLVARSVFGARHTAVTFLLLVAIADDAIGLAILAVFYPQDGIEPIWFLATIAAMGIAMLFRSYNVRSHWAYLIGPGVVCWTSFLMANVHPALGLVPIVPFMPTSARSEIPTTGICQRKRNTLEEFEHFWKFPVEVILGLFGLVNAGVVIGSLGIGTGLVLVALLIGKPLGILFFAWVAQRGLGLQLPPGMGFHHVLLVGLISSIGFTVALFVSVAAFPSGGPTLDAVKMGALLSLLAAPAAILVARLLGVRPLDMPTPGSELAGSTTSSANQFADGHSVARLSVGESRSPRMRSPTRRHTTDNRIV